MKCYNKAMQEVAKNYVKHIHCFNYELIHLFAKTIVAPHVNTLMETYFQIVKLKGFLKIKGDRKSPQTATPTSTTEMFLLLFLHQCKKKQKQNKNPQTS